MTHKANYDIVNSNGMSHFTALWGFSKRRTFKTSRVFLALP